jgi:ATP-binding cassette, subfamily B (MDR/TAP), member 1
MLVTQMPENAGKRFLYSPSKLELVVLVSTLISAITAGAISVIMPVSLDLAQTRDPT